MHNPRRGTHRAGRALRTASLSLFFVAGALPWPGQPSIVAIGIVLELDPAGNYNATAANARLRRSYPHGYLLDATHVPHVALVHGFVREGDLDAITAAITGALQSAPRPPIDLSAVGYRSSVYDTLAVIAYELAHAPALAELAGAIADAVRPFSLSHGIPEAFARTSSESITPQTVESVARQLHARRRHPYRPHIALGVARPKFGEALETAPFTPFTFAATTVAMYHLGDQATARRRIWAWTRVGNHTRDLARRVGP